MSDDVHLAADEHNAEQLIEMSDVTWQPMGQKTMVMVCQLPNGFEVTVSSAPVDPDDFDESAGQEMCRAKLKDRIIELLAFQQHGELE